MRTFRTSVIAGLVFLFAGLVGSAQHVAVGLVATNSAFGSNPQRTLGLTLGVHADGTDGIDSLLGEREIPNIGFPSGVFYVWSVLPKVGDDDARWAAPTDYRKLAVGERQLVAYDISAEWEGGTLTFTWPGTKPVGVDSAWLVDKLRPFPNNIFKAKLWSDTKLEFDFATSSIYRFQLLVWYNNTTSDVAYTDDGVLAAGRTYPIPCTDHLIAHHVAATHARMIDLQGRTIAEVSAEDTYCRFDTSQMPGGAYIVEFVRHGEPIGRNVVLRQ